MSPTVAFATLVRRLQLGALLAATVLTGCGHASTRAPGTAPADALPSAAQPSAAASSAIPDAEALILVIDGSGSMVNPDVAPNRMEAAKRAAANLLTGLDDGARVGLMAFGTKTGNSPEEKAQGCRDVSTLAPVSGLTADHRERLSTQVSELKASGHTPLGLATRQAAEALPDRRGTVVVLSDGEEGCAPPGACEVANQVRLQNPHVTISTVGLRVGDAASNELSCMANAGGGLFVTADTTEQLTRRLSAAKDARAASSALTSTGLGPVQLGWSYDRVAGALPGFPGWDQAAPAAGGIPGTGLVQLIWQDCAYVFDHERHLVGLQPQAGRTVDGIGIGAPVSEMVQYFGAPVAVEGNGRDTVAIFEASKTNGTAFRVGLSGPIDAPGATVTNIVLCRCLPSRPSARPTTVPTQDCTVPNDVVRQGLDNPELVITSTKCSKVDPDWAELTANYRFADPNMGTSALIYVHRVGGEWEFVAGAFRYDVWCRALQDRTFPSDFRADLESRC